VNTALQGAYFSFAALSNPTSHRDHNEWHQLDHLPENRLLPSVAWGDRWVRTPACARSSPVAEAPYSGLQYLTAYFFRDAEQGVRDLVDLGAWALQVGRRPELAWWDRANVSGRYRPIRGCTASRVTVSPDAVVARPGTGVFCRVSTVRPYDARAQDLFLWHDRLLLPGSVELPGVAGAWTFSAHADLVAFPEGGDAQRVTLFFLDGDVMQAAEDLWAFEREHPAPVDIERVVLATALETIQPHRWDWFDEAPA
jgi:hypothetical protein